MKAVSFLAFISEFSFKPSHMAERISQ